jgi:small-conductance mechanosensitive channel
MNFHIWVFVKMPDDRGAATHELNSAISEAFAENGIEIPLPRRDQSFRNRPPSEEAPEETGR